MSDQITAIESNLPYTSEEKDEEESRNHKKIISIRTGKLLKLRHKIKALRDEALNGYTEELKEFKIACNSTNALLGELNDDKWRTKIS